MAAVHVSEKGQLTLPIAARRQLGITTRSKVEVVVGDNEIILRPVRSIRDVKGIFRKAAEGKTADWEAIRRETMETVVKEIMDEDRG
jgi:AbrB family looped-hinge helix DNA binding protein